MIEDADVDLIVRTIKTRADGKVRYRAFMALICSCLRALSDVFPEVALNAFRVAEQYWIDGRGTVKDVENARESCWDYLDRIGAGTELNSKKIIAVRAVICALYPEQNESDFDEETLRWFVMLLNRMGDYSSTFVNSSKQIIGDRPNAVHLTNKPR